MSVRAVWLDEGLGALARSGISGLRIDALAAALGLTKGSFYHHFVDLADYRRALLGHVAEQHTTRFLEANERLGDLSGLARLEALAAAVLADQEETRGLDVALRGWAAQDDDARSAVERIDAARLGYLEELFTAAGDREQAALRAQLTYWVLIGSRHALPPGTVEQVAAIWAFVLEPLREAAQ